MSQLKVNSIVPAGGLPSGSNGGIIQVKAVTKTDTFSTSNNSYTDITGLSVTITPSSNASKIFITGHMTGMGTSNTRQGFRLMRDSTPICRGDANGNRDRNFGGIYSSDNDNTTQTVSVCHLDDPGTTSAVTYKIQTINSNNTDAVYVNRSNSWTDSSAHNTGTSNITVMEVSG